jgi:hypothetical protein
MVAAFLFFFWIVYKKPDNKLEKKPVKHEAWFNEENRKFDPKYSGFYIQMQNRFYELGIESENGVKGAMILRLAAIKDPKDMIIPAESLKPKIPEKKAAK